MEFICLAINPISISIHFIKYVLAGDQAGPYRDVIGPATVVSLENSLSNK
jgi:hypothetical protein